MSETLNTQQTVEQRVFGDAFSLLESDADVETQTNYQKDRSKRIAAGETAWLAHTIENGRGLVANLYVQKIIMAKVIVDRFNNELVADARDMATIDPDLSDIEKFEAFITNAEQYAENSIQTKL